MFTTDKNERMELITLRECSFNPPQEIYQIDFLNESIEINFIHLIIHSVCHSLILLNYSISKELNIYSVTYNLFDYSVIS